MKKQTKVIVIAAVAAVLLFGLGFALFKMPMPEQEKWVYVDEEVKKGTITVAVTERGSLDYNISIVAYDMDLYLLEKQEEETVEIPLDQYLQIEEICVAPGQRVAKGDALLALTEESVDEVRMLLSAAVVDAKMAFWEAQLEYERLASDLKTAYDSTKVVSKYADDIYEDTSKAVDNEITSMDKEISRRKDMADYFEERLEEAQKEYDEADKAYQTAKKASTSAGTKNVPNYLVLSGEYQEAKTRYYNAKSGLAQAKENLENNQQQIEKLKVLLEDAKARVAIDKLNAKSVYDADTTAGANAQVIYDVAIAELAKALEQEKTQLEGLEEQLSAFDAFVGEEGVLYAEDDGIVLETYAEKGDELKVGHDLLTYTMPQKMTIAVAVEQADVVVLQTGDRVAIRFDAYPESFYEGTIRTIDSTGIREAANTVSYQVVIGVNGDTEALYRGMAADVSFVKEQKENALYVSERAIVEENDRTYVYVQTVSGGYTLKEVETGMHGDVGIEILSGLEEGDIIYILMTESEAASGEIADKSGIPTISMLNHEGTVSGNDVSGNDVSTAGTGSGNSVWGPSVSGGDVSGGDIMSGKEEEP